MHVSVERLEAGRTKLFLLSTLRSQWTPYCLYSLLAAICWQAYAFRLSPDQISYISIAQQYFTEQWWDAVNIFWSPLLSWLTAIGLATRLPAYPVMRAIVVLWGLIGLAGIHRLTLQYQLCADLSAGMTLIAAPMLLSFAILGPSPDFIALCLLILYLSSICPSCPEHRRSWLLGGVIGAFLYLTKAYMFGFVIAHLTITTISNGWSSVGSSVSRKILYNYIGAMACFFIVSCPWIVLISLKAGHPMISAAGSWNHAKARMDPRWFPQNTEGLFAPPTPASVSVWEDPSRMPIPSWSPLSSAKAIQRQIQVAARNSLYFIYFTVRTSPFSIVILPFFIWLVVRRIRQQRMFDASACLLCAYVIYPLGYILIALGEQRYVWIENVLLLMMFGCVANFLWMHGRKPSRVLMAMTVVAGLSFWCDPLATVVYHWRDRRDLHSLAESLRRLKLSGNVASNGQWGESLYLCYELGLRYYGIPREESTVAMERDFRNYAIKYLFVWNDGSASMPIRPGQELSSTKMLKVYRLCTVEKETSLSTRTQPGFGLPIPASRSARCPKKFDDIRDAPGVVRAFIGSLLPRGKVRSGMPAPS